MSEPVSEAEIEELRRAADHYALPALHRLLADRKAAERDYAESLAGIQANVRAIDVALHGEAGAARQASACDLIDPARLMRERAEAAEERMREAEATLQVLADAVGHMRVPQTLAEAALQLTVTLGPALARARAFLSTGKPSKAKETA